MSLKRGNRYKIGTLHILVIVFSIISYLERKVVIESPNVKECNFPLMY